MDAVTVQVGSPEWVQAQLIEIESLADGVDIVRALVGVAEQLLPSPLEVRRQAWDIANTIEDKVKRAYALIAIASHAPEENRVTALEKALEFADIQAIENKTDRARILIKVLPDLIEKCPSILDQTKAVIKTIEDNIQQARILLEVAVLLPDEKRLDLLKNILELTKKIPIESFGDKFTLEIETATQFPGTEEALDFIQTIEDEFLRFSVLKTLAPELLKNRPQLLNKALNIAGSLNSDLCKSSALAVIVPQTPNLDDALETAYAIQDADARSKALAEIAVKLPDLERALDIAYEIEDTHDRSEALAGISGQLTDLNHALQVIPGIEDSNVRAQALVEIASKLDKNSPSLLDQALDITQLIQEDSYRNEALNAIAPLLPEKEYHDLLNSHPTDWENPAHIADQNQSRHLEDALNAAKKNQDESALLKALRENKHQSDAISAQSLKRILETIQTIQDEIIRVEALTLIAKKLPESARLNILSKGLGVATTLKETVDYFEALALLAPHVGLKTRWNILEAATKNVSIVKTTDDILTAAKYIPQIVALLPFTEELLNTIPTIDRIFEDKWIQHETIISIAPKLSIATPELKQKVFNIAQSLKAKTYRARVLSEIAPYMPADVRLNSLKQALQSIVPEKEERFIVDELERIVLKLSKKAPHLVEQALAIAKKIEDESERERAFAIIAPHLPTIDQTLDQLEKISRAEYQIGALALLASQLSSTDIHPFESMLTIVRAMDDSDDRQKALLAIVPYLPKAQTHLFQKAFKIAQTIRLEQTFDYDKARNPAIESLAQEVDGAALDMALESILQLPQAASFLVSPAIRLTEDFVLRFPKKKHTLALNIVHHISNNSDKTKFLSALIPHLSPGRIPEILKIIKEEFDDDQHRVETLCNLLPYLPGYQLTDAWSLVIDNVKAPYPQTTAIVNLIAFSESYVFQEPVRFNAILLLIQNLPHPHLKTRILQSLSSALSAVWGNRKYIVLVKQPVLAIYALAKDLKASEQSDFSYERAVSYILVRLAPSLAPEPLHKNVAQTAKLSQQDLHEIFDTVRELTDPGYQADVLIAFAPYFSDFVQDCLSTYTGDDYRNLLNIKVRFSLVAANDNDLSFLASADGTFLGTLDSFCRASLSAIRGRCRKAEAWIEIARTPGGIEKQAEALRCIRGLTNSHVQAKYLQRLIPVLQSQHRRVAANIIGDIRDDYHRGTARIALARRFSEPEFFEPAYEEAKALKEPVQKIEQLSTLAIDTPELLPEIIKLAEDVMDAPLTKSGEQRSNGSDIEVAYVQKIKRQDILYALAPHLPMRINRELQRERATEQFISSDLYKRALFLVARSYRDALQGGSLRNDTAQDEDFLGLKKEIDALSNQLLIRDLEPPMAVGILGGWGGGKSYIMHLMQSRMTEIRSQKVDLGTEAWHPNPSHEKLSPYVGHVYQIKFDAWTFSKSDLWASLMQTIFFELDRQITLEMQISSVLKKAEASSKISVTQRQAIEEKIWSVLYKANESDRQWFLKQVLAGTPNLLEELNSMLTAPDATGFLWRQFCDSQDEALKRYQELKTQIEHEQEKRKKKREEIRKDVHTRFQSIISIQKNKSFQRVDAVLGTSSIILRQRIGSPLLKRINAKVSQELENIYQESPTDRTNNSKQGLWQILNETISEYEDIREQIGQLETKSDSQQSSENSTKESKETKDNSSQKDLEALKKKASETLEKIEATKLDIHNLAADVIDQQYGWITLNTAGQWIKKNTVLLFVFLILFIGPIGLLVYISLNSNLENAAFKLVKRWLSQTDQSLTQLAAVLATLTPALLTFQSLLKSGQKWFEETQLALSEYQQGVERRTQNLAEMVERNIESSLKKDEELQKLDRTISHLESQLKSQEADLPENVYASLADFVNSRLQAGSYEKRLGLMQQVKQDLAALSDRLLPPRQADYQQWEAKLKQLKEGFPRGPARVVVYIDDLDRCPPDRVVEVLEAVQLLVKTSLFIAVLAIDERYITRALEKYYDGVLSRHGSPSGSDYLEKIIQIPYRVRPIMESALDPYLRSQVSIQDNATGGTKFSEFTRQEFDMLLTCCQNVSLSPRTLKRLTNVYKLFKLVCRTRGTRPSPSVQQAILAFLAFSGRYPDLMRGIFDVIETCFDERRKQPHTDKTTKQEEEETRSFTIDTPIHLESNLRDVFLSYELPQNKIYLRRELEKLKYDALKTTMLPVELTLEQLTHEIFNLIRSFSFVGDIGEDPEDYRSLAPHLRE